MKKTIVSAVLIFGLICAFHGQILAIDFGTQFIKASIVHSGAGKSFSIVENPKSQRKFINSLGFYSEERLYQSDSLPKRSRMPANCLIFSRLLIDLHNNPSLVQTVKKELVLDYINSQQADQLLAKFVLNGFSEETKEISLVETIAMILKYVKLQAQKSTKGAVKDAILIVPNFWNIHQRRFLLQAAEMADLYVLSLITENVGASINYALSQRSSNQTENILFYNIGSNSLQMTLAQYRQIKVDKAPKPVESIFILGDYGKPYVGGLKLDRLVCNHFMQKFEQQYNKKLNQRGEIRLLSQSAKIKQVLSANKEATVFVEGIMDGIDFKAKITRSEFEKLAQPTLKELTSNIKRFIFDHDLKPEDIKAIQLIGGSTRIPKLQSLIIDNVDNKTQIGSHINGDEAMVLGAAFYGANSSKKFKVKGINLYDGFNFQMRLVLRNSDQTIEEGNEKHFFKNVTVFKKKSRFGLTKQVSFKCKQNIIADIYKEDESGLELLKSYNLTTIESVNQTNFKVSLTFLVDPLEVVVLKDVKISYQKEEIKTYLEKVRKINPVKKEQKQSEKESEEAEKESDQESEKDQDSSKQNQKSQEESKAQEKSQGNQYQEEKGEEEEKKQTKQENETKSQTKKKKKRSEKVEYETIEKNKTVTKEYEKDIEKVTLFQIFKADSQLNSKIEKAKKIMGRFEGKENEKRQLSESKNKLEALIYELTDKLQMNDFTKYAQEKEVKKLREMLGEKVQWHEESTSNNKQDYLKQYKELNDPVTVVKKRMTEHREREDVKKRAYDIIGQYRNLTSKIQKGKQWITDEEVLELNLAFTASETKIQTIFEKINKSPLNQDSIYKNKDLIKEAELIKEKYFTLKGKPKPKKEKVEEKKSENDSSEDSDEPKKEKNEDVNEDEL